ncbi:hypothetical protein [Nonomuraea sp. SYSU D8015]|uniref:hypothetical protein n=1 Tax=Nonomuraea sp. SYSU D8015 TaxID=2593644 RepID=UPI0016614837|nr:hypothetical protein [Nonomuraea sp. SYSU D8015]
MANLPEDAVKAAADALSGHSGHSGHSSHPPEHWQTEAQVAVQAAAPILATQAQRELLAAARACVTCGDAHQCRRINDGGMGRDSWAHPADGHPYRQSSRAAAEWIARQIGEAHA